MPKMEIFSHVVQVGDPKLRQKSEDVQAEFIQTETFKSLIASMRKTMAKYDCVGLSAVQVGLNLNVFIMELNLKQLEAQSDRLVTQFNIKQEPFRLIKTF